MPDSASTWWADSVVPSARCGSSSASSRSSPSISEYSRRHSTEGSSRPASISASASSSAARRAVPSASACAGVLALEHEGLTREFLGALRGHRRKPARHRAHGASLSHESGVLRMGRGRTELPRQESSGVRPSCAAALVSPASTSGPGPVRDARRIPIKHTVRRNGVTEGSANLRGVRRLDRTPVCLAAGACGSDARLGTTPRPPTHFFGGGKSTPSRRSHRKRARQAGGREQVGELVRALPARVPAVPQGGRASARARSCSSA